ncbi:MAG: GNAT family N-acetyltransferase [Gammaproteobacteria bacterium]|jgi:hypothetical protein|nr:GNAT family N-acetyltransferase [Gammaproteobacteria bacterium]HJN94649.1 GNAT family N-acetyltransferase [Gammaproteobacteria bacterium]|tara:strand:+ start:1354 stop:2532 length:1179 start_codon:yes stop_codon:yes gene_type:complete
MNSPETLSSLRLSFVESIDEIGATTWNDLASTENPFTRFEFLHALERTGCTNRQTGWQPHHVLVYSDDTSKTPLAVMPLYLKTNSWGEYVFDWSWANAYKSHGFQYYPKFVTAVPFTPSPGQRIFTRDASSQSKILKLIADKIKEKAEFIGASSWHVLFPYEQEHQLLSELDIQPRIATQFHWHNKAYESFDDFLTKLTSRKRKSIRKERKHVSEQGITFRRTEGADISEQQWADFFLVYQSTYMMRGMQGYLELEFFLAIAEIMPEQLVMINAVQDNRDIAAALFFKNDTTLFGRYWGSRRDHQFLHFETCYYQGQEYAIEHQLKSFDSGTQGEHKIQRGFEPIITHSNHWIANQAFTEAITNFLNEERAHIKHYQEEAASLLPYKKEHSD